MGSGVALTGFAEPRADEEHDSDRPDPEDLEHVPDSQGHQWVTGPPSSISCVEDQVGAGTDIEGGQVVAGLGINTYTRPARRSPRQAA